MTFNSKEKFRPVDDSFVEKNKFCLPSSIDINTIIYEISGICNAKCPYCATGAGFTKGKPSRFIPLDEFSRGLNRLYELNLLDNNKNFELYNWGDPLLHPQLDKILNLLNENDQSFALSTNGSYVSDKLKSSMLENLSYFRVSLPGFSKKSYNKIHKIKFNKVLENISILKDLVPSNILEVGIFIYKFNVNEISDACDYFSKNGIRYQILMPYLTDQNEAFEYLSGNISRKRKKQIENDMFTDHIKPLLSQKEDMNYCPYLINQLVIDEYNNILTCCVVSKKSEYYKVGSLFEMTKEEIINFKTEGIKICSSCFSAGIPYWFSHNRLPNRFHEFNTQTHCYVDTGKGFSEYQKVSINIYKKNHSSFEISFETDLFEDIKFLRWDPVEGQSCSIKLDKIQTEENGDIRDIDFSDLLINGNQISENIFRFDTIDPWFIIPADKKISKLKITGSWISENVNEELKDDKYLSIFSKRNIFRTKHNKK